MFRTPFFGGHKLVQEDVVEGDLWWRNPIAFPVIDEDVTTSEELNEEENHEDDEAINNAEMNMHCDDNEEEDNDNDDAVVLDTHRDFWRISSTWPFLFHLFQLLKYSDVSLLCGRIWNPNKFVKADMSVSLNVL